MIRPVRISKNTVPLGAMRNAGFTLLELTIGLAIMGVMILIMMVGYELQIFRSRDAVRKSDLRRIKVVFEDYYNDHDCYPPPELLERCGSGDLAPYLGRVPCDPLTKLPYTYVRDQSCRWYGVFTTLEDESDKVVGDQNCDPTCQLGNTPHNYAVTNGGTPLTTITSFVNSQGTFGTPVPVPTPTPAPEPGPYACDPHGQCNSYANPLLNGCPLTFADPVICQEMCANPINRCDR